MAKPDRKLSGSAGEHYVCSMLARHGWAASLTRDGLARTDVLAVHHSHPNRPMIEVQVKTMSVGDSFPLGTKGTLHADSDREWYVFVVFRGIDDKPDCYIVPRDHVAAATWICHQHWLTDPLAAPGKRNAPMSNARVKAPEWMGYRDRWEDLVLPTTDVPVRLRQWMSNRMAEERVGLPEGHPWQDPAKIPAWEPHSDPKRQTAYEDE